MAKQDGIMPLKGTIDNLSFYKTKDGYIARKKTSVDPDKIAKGANYARTREAMSNFQKAGKAGKLLRLALRSFINKASDHRMVTRLSSKMIAVIQADATNPRGKKNVLDGETELLKGFEFNVHGKLSTTFFASYEASIDRASGQMQIKIPPFVPQDMVAAPQGATHFQLHLAGVAADFEGEQFTVQSKSSEASVWNTAQQPEITLAISLPPNSTHPLFLVMGINFFVEDIGTLYALHSGAYNALAIIQVAGV